MKKLLRIEQIVIDNRFQSRAHGLNMAHVSELAEAYDSKEAEFIEAPRVFDIPKLGYCLTRGFHRYDARRRAGAKTIECEVKGGNIADAVQDAVRSNIGHGLKRTDADKRRCVQMLLSVHDDWTDRKLAEEAGVTHPFVGNVRKAVLETITNTGPKTPKKPRVRTGADGRSYVAKKGKDKEEDVETASGKKAAYPHPDDKVPDLKGVYRPRCMRNNDNHEVTIDAHNNSMPDRIGDIFVDTSLREALADAIDISERYDELLKRINKLKRKSTFPFVEIPKLEKWAEQCRTAATELADHLRDGTPYIVCPECHGSKCRACRQVGYISRGVYHLHPEYQKKARAS